MRVSARQDARVALFFMERPMLDAVYDKAHATKLESNLIKEIRVPLLLLFSFFFSSLFSLC